MSRRKFAPDVPTDLEVSDDGTTLTGKGQPGTEVEVKDPSGAVIGTGTVGEHGTFEVELNPSQLDGETLEVILTDTSTGRVSGPGSVEAPDFTPPDAPYDLEVSDDGTILTGKGESGTYVEVKDPNGKVIGEGTVDDDGTFEVELNTPQTDGEELSVTLADEALNKSEPGFVEAPGAIDGALTVAAEIDSGNDAIVNITGTSADVKDGEVTLTITDSAGTEVSETVAVDADGMYSLALDTATTGLVDGELTIVATAQDNNGNDLTDNTSVELDAIDGALTVEATIVDGEDTLDITGSSQDVPENGEVTITITSSNGGEPVVTTAEVGADGNYSVIGVDLSGLVDGELTIEATAQDNNGNGLNASTTADLNATDGALTVEATIVDGEDTLDITGSSQDVPENGEVIITITSSNGGEPVVTTAEVDADGNYSVTGVDLSGLVDGELTIVATAQDNNGNGLNASTTADLNAIDGELTVTATIVDGEDTLDITGSSQDVPENGEVTITITSSNGGEPVVTTAEVDADGNYSVTGVDLSGLVDGELTIEATAQDNNGNDLNASTTADLNAIDGELTVTATIVDGEDTLDITGSSQDVPENGEVTITITSSNGGEPVVTTAEVDADGNYSVIGVDLSGLVDGELTIEATAQDNNGNGLNASTTADLNAIDGELTVTATIVDGEDTLDITGSSQDVPENGEVTITITSSNGGEPVVTTAEVDADGNYSVTGVDLSGLVDGELTIVATAQDNNGNDLNASTTADLNAIDGELTVTATIVDGEDTLDITGSSQDVPENGEVTITITSSNGGEPVVTTAEVDADGNYSVIGVDLSGLVDGELTIEATAQDNNGNGLNASTTADLNAIDGELTVTATIVDGEDTLDITGSSQDVPENGEVTITITSSNGGEPVVTTAEVDADGNYSVTGVDLSGLVDGELTIVATAQDNNGNDLNASTTADLNAIDGELTVTATIVDGEDTLDITGSSQDVPENGEVTITITSSNGGEPVVTTAEVDADGNYSVTGVDLSGLVDGELTIEATAQDNNGNDLSASTTADLNAIDGELTVTATIVDGEDTLDITGSSQDVPENGEVIITITSSNGGEPVVTTAEVGADGNYSVIGVDLSGLVDGELTIEATAQDNNGNGLNASTTADLNATDGALTVEATIVDGEDTLDITGSSQDVPENGEVTITITSSNGGEPVVTTAEVDADGNYSVTGVDLSGLVDGELTIVATAQDNNGNDLDATDNAILSVTELVITFDSISEDSGIDGDFITSDSTLVLSGTVSDPTATVEVEVDGQSYSAINDGTGSWTLDLTGTALTAGTYEVVVTANATDGTGKTASTTPQQIEIIALDAVNDDTELGMGDPAVTIHPSATVENVQVLNVASGSTSPDAGTTFTIEPDHVGEVAIQINQVALAAVAKGFRVDVYDADNNLVYSGVTEGSLVGDVGGLDILGVTGDDSLTAVLTGLAPGDYSVVVGNDESKLAGLLGDGLTLTELGDKGVVLGPDNQQAVLDAVEAALNDSLLNIGDLGLGALVRPVLEGVLDTTTVIGAGELVGLLTAPLDALGITGLLGFVVDELADALLQNTLDAFEFTDITTTVTEYSFDTNAPISGNVIEGEAGVGEDKVVPGSFISEVKLASEVDGIPVPAGGSVEIEGLYGTLTLSADGSYSYVANGDPASVGQSDEFTYTLSDGHSSDSANLSIEISGGILPDLNPQPDNVDLDMGAQSATVHAPETDRNVTVVGLVGGSSSEISGVPFTVVADHLGEMHIEVSQMALAAVASAFAIDVVDADGNVVFTAITPDSALVGDVAGLPVLGVTGSDTLTATVTGLEPGSYTVVVRSDESAISSLLTGLSLQELGDNGVILGQDNQDLVLDAVDTALGSNPLSGAVRDILELTLKGLNGLGVDKLIDVVSSTLTVLGLGSLVETVLAAVAENLVSNTLTLLQSTEVTTTLTEYQFEGDLEFTGNVVTGEGDGNVGDGLAQGGVVTQVTNSAGEVFDVLGSDTGTVTIAGLYGQLTISKDGSYTYDAKGARAGLGEEEVFTYTVTNGAFNADGSRVTEEATLTIAIDGQGTAGDIAFAEVEYDFATEPGVNMEDTVNYSWTGVALGLPVLPTGNLTGSSLIVDEGTTQDVSITVNVGSLLGVGAGVTVFFEAEGSGNWSTYQSFDTNQLLGLLGSGGSGNFVLVDVPEGEYRVRAEVDFGLLGVAGNVNVALNSTVTKLDEFVIAEDGISSATGNLLENDVLRDVTYELKVSSDGVNFESTSGGVVTLEGTHGSLTVQENGSYTYTPKSDLAHFDAMVSESFTYQVAYDGGPTEEAKLTVFITPSGAGMPDIQTNSAGFDFSNLETFAMDDGLDDEPLTLTLEDVLGTDEGGEFVTLPEPEDEQVFAAAAADNTAVDAAVLDMQPTVDPLDDLLEQNNLYI